MPDSFGARVRHHREQHGVSLTAVAEQTKIKVSLLEGLERDDLAHWPNGIFRRAYVRSYAVAIGLDADRITREFLAAHPDSAEPVEAAPEPPARLRSLIGTFGRRKVVKDPPPHIAERTVATSGASAALALAPVLTPAPAPVAKKSAARPALDLLAAAHLCTELGRVEESGQIAPLLREAASILGARGVIVWVWDALASELKPALVHGYSDRVRKQLRAVRPNADNATATAFRTAQTRLVGGSEEVSSAIAVPLMTAAACGGVLAIELPHGAEQVPAVQAVATFFAAMLAQLVAAN